MHLKLNNITVIAVSIEMPASQKWHDQFRLFRCRVGQVSHLADMLFEHACRVSALLAKCLSCD